MFGAKSSPCCAGYALQATAKNNVIGTSKDVVSSAFRNAYVDDVSCFYKSTNATVDLVSQTHNLLKSSGFHLTKFMSNNDEVSQSVPGEDFVREVHFGIIPGQFTYGGNLTIFKFDEIWYMG